MFNLDSLIDSFMLLKECLRVEFLKVLNNEMTGECKKELVGYLNKEAFSFKSKKEFIQLIKNEFPIFVIYNKPSEFVATNIFRNHDIFRIPELIIEDKISINPVINALDCSSCKNLASVLEIPTWQLSQIIDKTFDFYIQRYYIQNQDLDNIHTLVKWVIENRNRISKYEPVHVIESLLTKKKIFSNQTKNALASLSELYDPTNKYVKILVDENRVLNSSYEPFYSFLKPHLLKPENIDLNFFDKYMTELEKTLASFSNFDENKRTELINKIKAILEFIFEMNLKNTEFLSASLKYKWIPSQRDGFCHSCELYSPVNIDLIGLVRPIVDENVVSASYFNSLKIKTQINQADVFENYSFMVEHVETKDTKLLENIYSIISKVAVDETFDIKKEIDQRFLSDN